MFRSPDLSLCASDRRFDATLYHLETCGLVSLCAVCAYSAPICRLDKQASLAIMPHNMELECHGYRDLVTELTKSASLPPVLTQTYQYSHKHTSHYALVPNTVSWSFFLIKSVLLTGNQTTQKQPLLIPKHTMMEL